MEETPELTRQSGERVWFGVGCFHFAYERQPPFTLEIGDYADELKEALESITAVTNLEIYLPQTQLNPTNWQCTEIPGRFDDGYPHFPSIAVGRIQFELHIPARVQDELAEGSASAIIGTERFGVYVDYRYEGPVAFVVLLDPAEGEPRPSTAVEVVRNFLKRELRQDKTFIRVCVLGPSPFHADFCLSLTLPASAGTGTYRVEHTSRMGYDLVEFSSDHVEFGRAIEALDGLFFVLGNELGFFYWVHAMEARAMDLFAAIQEQVDALTSLPQRPGLWSRMGSKARRSSLLQHLFASLISFDVRRTFEINERGELYRITYREKGANFLRHFVDRAIADAVAYPTKEITSLVGFLERRRSKAVELAVVLFAGVIGGFAGAMITGVTGMMLSKSPQQSVPSETRWRQDIPVTTIVPSPTASASRPPQPTTISSPLVSASRPPVITAVPSAAASTRPPNIPLQDLLRAFPTSTPAADVSPRIRLQVLDLPSPSPK